MNRLLPALMLGTCACTPSVDLFVPRVWSGDEAVVIVAVGHDGRATPTLVGPDDGVQRTSFSAAGVERIYARTYPSLDRSLEGCEVIVHDSQGTLLGNVREAWVGTIDGGSVSFTVDDDQPLFDLRLDGCQTTGVSCEVVSSAIDVGATFTSLFGVAVWEDELALFGGGRRSEQVPTTNTLRYWDGVVTELLPDERLVGVVAGMEFDGDDTIGAIDQTVFRMDSAGVVTATAALPVAVDEFDVGIDGTAFVLTEDGAVWRVDRGTTVVSPFPTPPYGNALTTGGRRLGVHDANRLVVYGKDQNIWLYEDGSWRSILDNVAVNGLAADERYVLAAQDNAAMILRDTIRAGWRPVGDAFVSQNAIGAIPMGDGRFLIGGQAGQLAYYNGERTCGVPLATDRNVEALGVSPSGRVAYLAGERYRSGEPTLVMRLELP